MLQGDSNSFVSCFNWLKYNTLFSAVILECDMVMSLICQSASDIKNNGLFFNYTCFIPKRRSHT